MNTKLQGPTLPYILDLETGISSPRDRALVIRDPDPVSRAAIRRRAYANWQEEGCPNDHDVVNWLAAESELHATSLLRVTAMPAVPHKPLPVENYPSAAPKVTAGAPGRRRAAPREPSPMGQGAAADDIRDYAFHLYVQSGCDQAAKAECWAEANHCLDARIPKMALAAARRQES